jgi:glutathione synthase/RimK-type ligase-like ATP-grasp enzyme
VVRGAKGDGRRFRLTLIALATCATVPDWEVDDRVFHGALAARGIDARQCVWDDPHVDWTQFDLVLIRTTWDYQEKREAFVSWVRHVPVPLYNPASIVEWNTHKAYLRDLEAAGVPIVPTEWLARGTKPDIASLCERRNWPRAFLKPCIGATSRETLRFDAGDPAAQQHAERLLGHEDLMLQPYLSRVEMDGELSAIFVDGELTHAVRKVPVPGDYRVQDDFGAKDYGIEFPDVALARRVVEAVDGRLLYARADFLISDDGLMLTELELVEPSFFFRHAAYAAERLADAISNRL